MAGQRAPLRERIATLAGGLMVLAALAATASGLLYSHTAKDSFGRAVAEKLLQLALIVLLGAIVSLVVSWQAEARGRREDAHDDRHDFLRRLRGANQRVQVARRLLDAHDSARTYSEQMREM